MRKNEEIKQLVEKWEKHTDFLDGLENKDDMALLLENQRLFNEASNHGDLFCRISIPLVRKIYDPSNFFAYEIVSVQPMFGPTDLVYFEKFELTENLAEIKLITVSDAIAAKVRKLDVEYSPLDFPMNDEYSALNFDDTNENIDKLARDIVNDINKEIITDIRKNTGTIAKWVADYDLPPKEFYESLYVKIMQVNGVMQRKTLNGGGSDWILASADICGRISMSRTGGIPKQLGISEIKQHDTLNNKWNLYEIPWLENEIIMGTNKHNPYIYSPYVPLTETPVVLDAEDFRPRKSLLSRYGKKLTRPGSKFFAKIVIE